MGKKPNRMGGAMTFRMTLEDKEAICDIAEELNVSMGDLIVWACWLIIDNRENLSVFNGMCRKNMLNGTLRRTNKKVFEKQYEKRMAEYRKWKDRKAERKKKA